MNPPTDSSPPRLTLRFLFQEAVERFLNLEQGWLRTVRELFTQPGAMIRNYLKRDRKGYANPFGYLVLGTALSILAQTAGGIHERMLAGGTASSPGQLELAHKLSGIIQQNLLYVSFIILIPFAILMRWFFRRSGFNLAEIFVFGFYTSGHIAIMGLALLPLFLITPMPPYLYGILGLALQLTYQSYAAIGFFGGRIKTVVKTCLAYFLSFIVFIISTTVAAIIYILSFDPSFVSGETWDLVTAAEKGKIEQARALLTEGADVDMILQRTPLHVAAKEGHKEMVELLLEHDADVNAQDHLGRVPMYVALMARHEDIAWRLARAGTDATVRTRQGASLLIMAVRRENTAITRWLLEKGADVNAIRQGNRRATALITAAHADNMELVQLLLEHGADPSLTNEDGQTALDLTNEPAIKKRLRAEIQPP